MQTNYKNEDLTSHEISTAWNYMFMTVSFPSFSLSLLSFSVLVLYDILFPSSSLVVGSMQSLVQQTTLTVPCGLVPLGLSISRYSVVQTPRRRTTPPSRTHRVRTPSLQITTPRYLALYQLYLNEYRHFEDCTSQHDFLWVNFKVTA